MENSMEFSQKLKLELPYDLAIPLLRIHPPQIKTLIHKDTCTSMVTEALFTIAKIWKQPKCSSIDELKNVVYMYNGRLLSHKKKNEILSFVTTGMGLESIMLNKISQIEKDKYCIFSLICEI